MSQGFERYVPTRPFSVRRSELVCPAHSLQMMEKAAISPADEVIYDLEDGCAVSQKTSARATLVQALRSFDFGGKLRAFRANGVRTGLFYRDVVDVVEGAGDRLDVLVLPKVESPAEILHADYLLTGIEKNLGLPVGRIRIEVLLESAAGVLDAGSIARCSPRLSALIFGIADFAGDVGARSFDPQEPGFLYPRSQLLVAARAAGLDAIDHVTVQFKDLERCRKEAEFSSRLGFDGKWAIHPAQVPVINQVFTPTSQEIERAQALLKAYQEGDAAGRGAIVFEDQMVDAATLRVELKKVAVARKAGLLKAEDLPPIQSL